MVHTRRWLDLPSFRRRQTILVSLDSPVRRLCRLCLVVGGWGAEAQSGALFIGGSGGRLRGFGPYG